jgi:hypothetical protein
MDLIKLQQFWIFKLFINISLNLQVNLKERMVSISIFSFNLQRSFKVNTKSIIDWTQVESTSETIHQSFKFLNEKSFRWTIWFSLFSFYNVEFFNHSTSTNYQGIHLGCTKGHVLVRLDVQMELYQNYLLETPFFVITESFFQERHINESWSIFSPQKGRQFQNWQYLAMYMLSKFCYWQK